MFRFIQIISLAIVAVSFSASAQAPPRAVPVPDVAVKAVKVGPGGALEIIPASPVKAGPSYRLKPNDVVRLAVFEEQDLATSTRILKTGEAVFPLIGTVEIGGLSLNEATARIHGLYAADYLVDPKVTLTVDEYAVDFISVVGAVNSPGQMPIPTSGKLDLASAMASAGGLAPNADPNRITLIRASGSRSVYSQAAIQGNGGIPLSSGDRVVVFESGYLNKSVTVMGQVGRPGGLEFPLDGKLDLLTAIARAGGFTELANQKKVTVSRDGRTTLFDMREGTEGTSKKYMLRPDDIITVAERIW